MHPAAAVLLPFDRSPAIELGNRVWEKRVLPVGDVEYNGRMLHFTPEYLSQLEQAFAAGAYDQVSFQLADAKNTHTNDPERHRGEIVGMRARNDGLYIQLKPTPAGEKTLRDNPKLGVSARIVEGYARSDGQLFPAAIQHVLGTLDPRIPGLGAWTAIEAANTPAVTIDLSAASFAGQGEDLTMPDMNPTQQANLNRLLNLDPGQLDQMLGQAAPQQVQPPAAPATGEADISDLNDQELADLIDAMDDEDLAALESEFYAETGATASATGLSNEAAMAIELANARADEAELRMNGFQAEFDKTRYLNERRAFADKGVPPYLVDMAQDLLVGTGKTIDLASGKRVDAGAITRRLLEEFGRMSGMLNLDVELGSAMDEPAGGLAGAASTERQDLINTAKNMMGFR